DRDEHDPGDQLRPRRVHGRRREHRRDGRGHRLLRRRVPRHRGPPEEVRPHPRVRHADRRRRHPGRRDRHGRLRPPPRGRDPVRRLHLPRVRPDRVGGGAHALPHGGRMDAADGDPQPLRRGHLRRADALAIARGAVRPRRRHQNGDPVQPVRRQGPADRRDRGPGPGHVLRTQAHLQRPVRRLLRTPGDALGQAPDGRGPRRPLHRPARQGRRRPRRGSGDDPRLRHHGPRRARDRGGERRRRGGDRPSHHRPRRHRHDRGVGQEDRPLPRRPRGDAHRRLRRGARRAGAGTLFLSLGGACGARHRLGHALSARARMDIFPRPQAGRQ
ncbi:MAG: Branched-chain alpha-keto acid dehydrogenase, E1 component, beta subunit, partial [uncultured Sphingomonadaceae bacterium]